jgi:dynactin 4
MCPNCRNTLSVVPSDPQESADGRISSTASASGEPPFLLYCNHCRWDSADVGITFEKPTGLAGNDFVVGTNIVIASNFYIPAQLQKFEDSAPEALEFERLKEHFEPFLRSSLSASTHGTATQPHAHSSAISAAASALARDIPGVSKYTPLARSTSGRPGKDKSKNKDEMPEYKSRLDITAASRMGTGGGDADVEYMKHLEYITDVASLEQRWENSWAMSLQTRYVLHP